MGRGAWWGENGDNCTSTTIKKKLKKIRAESSIQDRQKRRHTKGWRYFLRVLSPYRLTGHPSGTARSMYVPGHTLTCTSKVKYFFRFLMIMTRNGSLIPRVFFGSAGHVMYVVLWEEETPTHTPSRPPTGRCARQWHSARGVRRRAQPKDPDTLTTGPSTLRSANALKKCWPRKQKLSTGLDISNKIPENKV